MSENFFLPLRASNWNEKLYLGANRGSLTLVQSCISYGADINSTIREETPLLAAARNGHLDLVEFLLDEGSNIHHEGKHRRTALTWAATRGHLAIVKILVRRGSDVEHCDTLGYTPAAYAAKYGHLQVVELLLGDVDKVIENGMTLLATAAHANHLEICKFLVDKGADLNLSSPLIHSVQEENTEVVKFLVQKGANVNQVTDTTPLAAAVKTKNFHLVDFLLNNGAHFSITSAFIVAVIEGSLEIVDLFLRKGANVNFLYKSGATPLVKAVELQNFEIVEKLVMNGANVNLLNPLSKAVEFESVEIVDFLLKNRANPDLIDRNGHSPLTKSLQNKYYKVVERLVESGADVNMEDQNGNVPLALALEHSLEISKFLIRKGANVKNHILWFVRCVEEKNTEMIKVFVDHGANVDIILTSGHSVLTKFAKLDNYKMVEYLLEAGADVNMADGKLQFPLSLAALNSNFQIFELLLKFGADIDLVGEKLEEVAEKNEDFAVYLETIRREKIKIESSNQEEMAWGQEDSCGSSNQDEFTSNIFCIFKK